MKQVDYMSAISVTKARDNIYQLISVVHANCQPITITNIKGGNTPLEECFTEDEVEPITIDGVEYQGTVKIIRMWTHYDRLR